MLPAYHTWKAVDRRFPPQQATASLTRLRTFRAAGRKATADRTRAPYQQVDQMATFRPHRSIQPTAVAMQDGVVWENMPIMSKSIALGAWPIAWPVIWPSSHPIPPSSRFQKPKKVLGMGLSWLLITTRNETASWPSVSPSALVIRSSPDFSGQWHGDSVVVAIPRQSANLLNG